MSFDSEELSIDHGLILIDKVDKNRVDYKNGIKNT